MLVISCHYKLLILLKILQICLFVYYNLLTIHTWIRQVDLAQANFVLTGANAVVTTDVQKLLPFPNQLMAAHAEAPHALTAGDKKELLQHKPEPIRCCCCSLDGKTAPHQGRPSAAFQDQWILWFCHFNLAVEISGEPERSSAKTVGSRLKQTVLRQALLIKPWVILGKPGNLSKLQIIICKMSNNHTYFPGLNAIMF